MLKIKIFYFFTKNILLSPRTAYFNVNGSVQLNIDSLALRFDSRLGEFAGKCSSMKMKLSMEDPEARLWRPEHFIVFKTAGDINIVSIDQTELNRFVCWSAP